jgi:hypothetical protein
MVAARPVHRGKEESFRAMSARAVFVALLAAATFARIWIVLGNDVSSANAYGFLCAEHPAPAYFDGPPGTALTVRAAALVGGSWWMLLGPFWAAAATLACWLLGRSLVDERAGILGAVALNTLPSFNSAALECGPEAPTIALVLAGLAIIRDTSRRQHAGAGVWTGPVAAGAAFAAATLFSYAAAPAGMLAASAPLLRPTGRRPAAIVCMVAVVLAVCAALAAPLAWNAHNAWIPIAGWTPAALAGFDAADVRAGIGALFFGLSPVFAVAVPWAVWRCARGAASSSSATFLLLAALPGVVFAGLAVYRGWDAGMAALLPAAILLPTACAAMTRPILAAAIFAAAVFSVPVLRDAVRGPDAAREVAGHLLALDERLSPDVPGGLFFIADSPALAASLSHHLRDIIIPPEGHPRVYVRESQDISSQFSLWPSYDDFIETPEAPDEFFEELRARNPFVGRTAIYVGTGDPQSLPQSIGSAFSEVRLIRETAGHFLYLCLDYQTMPL